VKPRAATAALRRNERRGNRMRGVMKRKDLVQS